MQNKEHIFLLGFCSYVFICFYFFCARDRPPRHNSAPWNPICMKSVENRSYQPPGSFVHAWGPANVTKNKLDKACQTIRKTSRLWAWASESNDGIVQCAHWLISKPAFGALGRRYMSESWEIRWETAETEETYWNKINVKSQHFKSR